MNFFALPQKTVYTGRTSNEVGIGLLVESAARAATVELSGFLHSGTPFLAIQTGSREARQLPHRGFTGRPTCLDCRPDWSLSGSHQTTEPSEPNMAQISPKRGTSSTVKPELTQERLREAFDYNPETGAFRWRLRPSSHFNSKRTWNAWNARFAGKETGSDRGDGYIALRLDCKSHRAHRMAWLYMTGEIPSGEIDHINQDTGDNRFSNLRVVSRAVNQQNQRRAQCSNKSTGLLGSYKHADGRFVASIRVDGKQTYLGLFDTAELAHAAYVKAKREHHKGCTL